MIHPPDPSELTDPQTTPQRLDEIADEYPEHHDAIVRHPNTTEKTRTWIFTSNRAIQQRIEAEEAARVAKAEAAAAAERRQADEAARRTAAAATRAAAPPPAPRPSAARTSSSSGRRGWLTCCGCIAILAILLFAVSSCGGYLGQLGRSGDYSSPETEGPASPAPSDALGMNMFIAPSGNIACLLTDGAVGCTILDRGEEAFGCGGAEFASYVVNSAEGESYEDCPTYFPGQDWGTLTTLEYGQSAAYADSACTAREDGITCWSQITGHGFTLSRGRLDQF